MEENKTPEQVPLLTPEHIERLNETLTSLKMSLDEKKPDITSNPPEKVFLDDAKDDLEELSLDGEQIENLSKALDKRDKKLLEKYNADQQNRDLKRFYDAKIESDFPDLKDKNSSLYKVTLDVLGERMKFNSDLLANQPSAVYDAAAVAAFQLGYKKSEDRRLSSLTGGYTEGSGSPPPKTGEVEVTDHQKHFAERMGIPSDVYKKNQFEYAPGGFVKK